jgi:proteasome lid subunit RPN8/RPN11
VRALTPERLQFGGHCLIVLERTLLAAAPDEGCALLLGTRSHTNLRVEWIWPCCNVWQPAQERPQRFSLDPREQLLAQRWCRHRGLTVLGAAHSHPTSAAVPSTTDQQLCVGPTLMVIRSGLEPAPAALRAWWMPEGEGSAGLAEPRELVIEAPAAAAGAERLGE